jgi:hypothetical protein
VSGAGRDDLYAQSGRVVRAGHEIEHVSDGQFDDVIPPPQFALSTPILRFGSFGKERVARRVGQEWILHAGWTESDAIGSVDRSVQGVGKSCL